MGFPGLQIVTNNIFGDGGHFYVTAKMTRRTKAFAAILFGMDRMFSVPAEKCFLFFLFHLPQHGACNLDILYVYRECILWFLELKIGHINGPGDNPM